MELGDLGNPAKTVVFRLNERNRLAARVIDDYVKKHAAMDVGVGVVGLIPGASLPALVTAIGLQAPVIYQPMARKLARIYSASPEEIENAEWDLVLPSALVYTAGLDIAADFGGEFLMQIAGELVLEAGFGAAVSTLIPIVGAFVGAGLDYAIATKMTRRVGRMVSVYFQNGAAWVGDKKLTYERSKELSNDLDDVRRDVRSVRETLIRNVKSYVDVMRGAMSTEQIQQVLRSKGIPDDLIADAL